MALRQTNVQTNAGGTLINLESRTEKLVAKIGQLKAEAVALRSEVSTNADGFYDNPGDLAEVDAVLASLKTDIQAAAAAL